MIIMGTITGPVSPTLVGSEANSYASRQRNM